MTQTPFRRRVFYIPGYDPIHPRRYRELYRKEGAEQARISGYSLTLRPKTGQGPYGWHATAATSEAEIEVLVWSDIVRNSMDQGIAATYLQLLRTTWAYIGSGALYRLMHLRKAVEVKGEIKGILEMRRHYANYFHGLPNFKMHRLQLLTMHSLEDIENFLLNLK